MTASEIIMAQCACTCGCPTYTAEGTRCVACEGCSEAPRAARAPKPSATAARSPAAPSERKSLGIDVAYLIGHVAGIVRGVDPEHAGKVAADLTRSLELDKRIGALFRRGKRS